MSITDLADARREAYVQAERLGVQLGELLREAREAGKSIECLEAETGYSRRQIYNLMGKES